jgi:hypothetical protein
MQLEPKQKTLFDQVEAVVKGNSVTANDQMDTAVAPKEEGWWSRYSLYQSGWHRFWFAMFVCVCMGFGILGRAPNEKERIASQQDFQKTQAEQCEKSCAPKSGYITKEPLNPLHRPPNDVGYRKGLITRCVCS